MTTASASDGSWASSEKSRPVSLVVQLLQRVYVLPWSLFLYAEGTEAEVRMTFHTHVVLVQGSGLNSLLSDLVDQMVTHLVEPDRTAKFSGNRGPQITALSISENR